MKPPATPSLDPPAVWRRADGTVISCVEKIKVLNENLAELRQMAQDAFEDALLLECPEEVVRQELHRLVDSLVDPWVAARGEAAKDR
ncbi:MAG TPA: hypothetical protein VLR71_04705 [Casimicrobiaceae bacterium]|nr:hypothetical protein [Casimicrobiaceae bacterium]